MPRIARESHRLSTYDTLANFIAAVKAAYLKSNLTQVQASFISCFTITSISDRESSVLTMARHASALVLVAIAATGMVLCLLHAVVALPAPLQPRATSADLSLQPSHDLADLEMQVQRLAEKAISTTATIVKGNAGAWHTAQLSVARSSLSATSLPSQGLALFAGGFGAFVSE